MYLAGVSVRRLEDITEALWGPRFPTLVSELNQKIYAQIKAWGRRDYGAYWGETDLRRNGGGCKSLSVNCSSFAMPSSPAGAAARRRA